MKKYLLILFLFLFSCTKSLEIKEKQVCDFGITEFNTTKRANGERFKPNHPIHGARASSKKVFYLEFDGATISGTTWNVNGTFIVTPSGLNQGEVNGIVSTIQSYYSQFDVTVTTDIRIYNRADTDKKQKIIFTEYNEWYGSQAGGVAYLNSFGWYDQSPAFIFTKLLGYNTHNIAEAGAHEMGHTVGCRHQVICENGVVVNQYNPGDGVNAPIMGYSYNVPYGSWWIGPNPLQCTTQDDVQIIASKLGLK